MKALRCHTFGAPDVLTIADLPTPIPAENEALIRIEAASIKPSDVKNVAGAMSQATLPLPRTPGRDYARVVEVGPSDLADFYHNETRLFGVDTLKMDLTDAAEVLEHLRPDFDSGDYRPAPIVGYFA